MADIPEAERKSCYLPQMLLVAFKIKQPPLEPDPDIVNFFLGTALDEMFAQAGIDPGHRPPLW